MFDVLYLSSRFFIVAVGLAFILAVLSIWILKNIAHEEIASHESEGDEPVRF